eukprot:Opistho-2@27135
MDVLRHTLADVVGAECADSVLSGEFSDTPCLLTAASKILGLSVILMCLVMKLPQVLRIWGRKSAEGISTISLLLELTSYSINLAYAFRHGYPFTTYGETFFLTIQDIILVLLVFKYNRNIGALFVLVSVAYGATMYAAFSGAIPMIVLSYAQPMGIPITTTSKLTQIVSNYRAGGTGQLSLTTWSMATYGTAVRIFTTMQEVKDVKILVSFSIAFFLNTIITSQIVYYSSRAQKSKRD